MIKSCQSKDLKFKICNRTQTSRNASPNGKNKKQMKENEGEKYRRVEAED